MLHLFKEDCLLLEHKSVNSFTHIHPESQPQHPPISADAPISCGCTLCGSQRLRSWGHNKGHLVTQRSSGGPLPSMWHKANDCFRGGDRERKREGRGRGCWSGRPVSLEHSSYWVSALMRGEGGCLFQEDMGFTPVQRKDYPRKHTQTEGNTYFREPLFMSDTIFPKACSSGFSEPFWFT